MTIEKLLEKARVFEKNNEVVTWKPKDFPEDMTEGSTLDELVSEGDYMYKALEEAVELIHDLAIELEVEDAILGQKVKPIKGLSENVYNYLVSHCKHEVEKCKDNSSFLLVYNEHRIFLELLERVRRDFIKKKE